MTNASRLRFMQRFASLDFVALEEAGTVFWWVTLTTPQEYWDRVDFVYSKALRRFHDRLEYCQRDTDYLGAFVRRELGGKNGALHYHLCIIGGKGITAGWLREVWGECLEYEGEKRLQVHVEEVTKAERIAKYMSKYCCKAGYEGKERPEASRKSAERPFSEASGAGPESASLTEAHNVGKQGNAYTGSRWWYIWGAKAMPWGELITVEGLDALQIAKRLRRIFRRWRLQVAMQRFDRKNKLPGFANRHWSPAYFEADDVFFQRLKRDRGGGFSLLVSPELLQRMVDAAAYAESAHRDMNALVPF